MRVGDRLAHILIEYGIPYVFGVPGGQTIPLYQGIMMSEGRIRHVLMRDERSAGYAADAFARLTGKTAVCDATVGPGATNLVSPLAEAYCSSIPIVAIISDVPRAWDHLRVRGNASQAIRQMEIFSTVSKWQTNVTDPAALDDIVDTAFRVATSGRPGPVVVFIPEDIFANPFPQGARRQRVRSARFPRHRSGPDPEAALQARELILQSHKPVLFVGGGALISGAFDEIRRLAEHLNAPVATTISGKGILEETHPLAIGVAGSMGNPMTNEIIDEADLVLFIGTKTGQIATKSWSLPKAEVSTIHLDVDPQEIDRNFVNSLPLVADARVGIRSLLDALGDEQPKTQWDCLHLSKRLHDWYVQALDKLQPSGEHLKPQAIMGVVNRFVAEDDLLVCDASLASGWVAVYCQLGGKPGRRYVAPRGLAGLGWGAAAAIGAALATEGKKRILHFAGDGGFAYSVQELEVMARLDLPVVNIIFNNDVLGWIKHVEISKFTEQGFISTDFKHVDFATVAVGFGARGHSVGNLEELASALDEEQVPEGPAVIDIASDQWETPVLHYAPRVASWREA